MQNEQASRLFVHTTVTKSIILRLILNKRVHEMKSHGELKAEMEAIQ